MKWLQRVVNRKLLLDGGKFEDVCWNEQFEGNTPREARKAAREKYPTNKGFRLGFTRKVK